MKNLVVVLTIFLFTSAGYNLTYGQVTQEWVKRYNGPVDLNDYANSIAVDDSGNVYVTGASMTSTYGPDYATIKYKSNGDLLWIRGYEGVPFFSHDEATSIVVDGSGNVYVTGNSSSFSTGVDYATIKYNTNGDSLWAKRYNGPGNNSDYATSIAVDGSGNVYVTGYSSGNGTGDDYATIKYNSNGDSMWVRRYNGLGNSSDRTTSLAVDGSGNVYVTGFSNGNGTYRDYATIKYNSNGDSLWVKRYNEVYDDVAFSLAVDGSGNVYVTGSSNGDVTGDDYLTIKYNSNGDSLWIKRYNGTGNEDDVASSLAVDGSGNVYVTGSAYDILSGYATIKYNSNGDSQWVQRYNSGSASSLALDGSGNIYVTGSAYDTITFYTDYATIKYNSNGDSVWVQRYNGPGNKNDVTSSIAVDGSANVYVTGSSDNSGNYPADYATIKYSSVTTVPLTLYLTALIEGFYNNITNKMISDTVRVYLRNSTVPYAIVDSSKTVLDSTGKGILNFFNASNSTPYYIVIKHRNSIETWSSGANTFLLNNLTYNFTIAANNAYGNNQKQIDTSPSLFGIYSGDVNQDGIIDASDLSDVDNDAFNSASGYVRTDVNGDDFVDASDLSIVDNNAFSGVMVMRP